MVVLAVFFKKSIAIHILFVSFLDCHDARHLFRPKKLITFPRIPTLLLKIY